MNTADKIQMISNELEQMSDEELINLAQEEGSDAALEALIFRYKNLVKIKVRAYFLIGADTEDLVQEGMIGLFKAVRDYKPNKISSFKAFADICVTRQIITAVKTATRNKHIPLNSYVSLSKTLKEENADRTLLEMTAQDDASNPEQLVIIKETFSQIERQIMQTLSAFEYKILECYLDGMSYQEISALLNKPVKSVDNALQRSKRKLSKCVAEHKNA